MHLSPATGAFSPNGSISFSPGDSFESIVRQVSLQTTQLYENGSARKWLSVLNIPSGEWFVTLQLIFDTDTLTGISVSIGKQETVPGEGWKNWSEANELSTLDIFNKWMEEELGSARSFPWGGVHASYDPHAGFSNLLISYRV